MHYINEFFKKLKDIINSSSIFKYYHEKEVFFISRKSGHRVRRIYTCSDETCTPPLKNQMAQCTTPVINCLIPNSLLYRDECGARKVSKEVKLKIPNESP